MAGHESNNDSRVDPDEGFRKMGTRHVTHHQTEGKGQWSSILIASLVALYYVISLSISFFNTEVLSKGRMNFPYPLFAALAYGVIQFALAAAFMAVGAIGNPGTGPIAAYKNLGLARYRTTIIPCAVAAALDISLSNCSLRRVSLSFYTMIKSSSPVFVLLFAFLLRLERPSWTVGAIMAVIGGGTLMTVWNPAGFDAVGFILVFSAAVMSGARWALTQLIIEHQLNKRSEAEDGTERQKHSGPLAAILFLTPPIALTMALLCQIFEGFPTVFKSHLFSTTRATLQTALLCGTGGVLTFALILTEYKVVALTSVVTFSIAGIFKELGMIALSVFVFGDRLLPVNIAGLVISILGIAAYNMHKIKKKRDARRVISRFDSIEGPGLRYSNKRLAHSDFYLALPDTERPLPAVVNPFLCDDDYASEYELEEMPGSSLTSPDASRSRQATAGSTSQSPLAQEAEAYFDRMRKQWSQYPGIEHHRTPDPTSAVNDIDQRKRSSSMQI